MPAAAKSDLSPTKSGPALAKDCLAPTQAALLASAREQFLEHGFAGASLSAIVAGAGVTKGALYGYYASKEELFCAVVEPVAGGLRKILGRAVASWQSFPAGERAYHMTDAFLAVVPELVALICAHRDETALLLDRAEGTRYGRLLDEMALDEVREGQSNLGLAFGSAPMGDATYGFLMSGYLHSIKLVLLSGFGEAEMIRSISDIQAVYEEGIMVLAQRAQKHDGADEVRC